MKIGLPLLIMGILTFFSIFLGNNFISVAIDNVLGGTVIINGTESTWGVEYSGYEFSIDTIVGAISILTVVAILAGVVGIQILGSGISESGHKTLTLCIVYGGLWFLLSTLSYSLIISIEVFGILIYVALTIVYVVGVIEKIAGG